MLPILTAALTVTIPVSPPPGLIVPAPPAPLGTCLPLYLAREATVIMLGMYGGRGAPAPFAFADTDGRPPHTVAVTGRAKGKVVLVLAAHEPTVWDLSAIKERVHAVVASGYYSQAVTGLKKNTPIRFTSRVGSASDRQACGSVSYRDDSTMSVGQMARNAARALGAHPQRFYGGRAPDSFDIDGAVPFKRPTTPDLSQIQAEAPVTALEGERAQAPSGEPGPLSSLNAEAGTKLRPARRVIEWDEGGTIIRDEGGGRITPPYERRMHDHLSPAPKPPFFTGKRIVWWFLFGGLLLWLWRNRKNKDAAEDARAEPLEPMPRSVPPAGPPTRDQEAPQRPGFPEPQVAELSALAAMTGSEPLVVALHRYGRELGSLSRSSFDIDLADEIHAIIDRHFPLAAKRYRQVRASLEGAGAEQADEILRRAVERLSSRLHELRDEQQHRDMNGIDEAGRFIDTRHPR